MENACSKLPVLQQRNGNSSMLPSFSSSASNIRKPSHPTKKQQLPQPSSSCKRIATLREQKSNSTSNINHNDVPLKTGEVGSSVVDPPIKILPSAATSVSVFHQNPKQQPQGITGKVSFSLHPFF